MNLEKYAEEVIEGEKNRFRDRVFRKFLWILSRLYRVIIFIRRKVYDLGLKKGKDLPAVVISVGNITVGGTGKTPVVKKIAEELKEEGYLPTILSRGYKGEFEGGEAVVSNGEEVFLSPEESGDEPHMLAKRLKGVPVLVGAKRSKTGSYACRFFEPDCIILDDGFQHWQMDRDFEVVVIDASNPFDNGYLLPRGKLRELPKALKRGDLFVLTKADQASFSKLEKLKKKLSKINPKAEISETKHAPSYLRPIGDGEVKEIELKEERVVAVSGIGKPKNFEWTLKDLGAKIVERVRYEDHHHYTKEDMQEIFTLASEKNADKIITTEKDGVSMEREEILEIINREKIPLEVLGIEIEVMDSEAGFGEFFSKLEV